MSPILLPQTLFSITVVVAGALAACLTSLAYFRYVRMERPAIGAFNARDLIVISVFIIGLPALYLLLPPWVLTGFLILTFLASLSIGYKPMASPMLLWTGISVLIGTDIWLARTQLGTVTGWQTYWALTSVIVLLGSVAVVNLYAQGGMRLRHVAFFAFGLAFYDAFFSLVIPLTPLLADAFQGHPLDPSIGMRTSLLSANIGIGDLLVYGMFTVVAYKAYGPPGRRLAIVVVVLFGAIVPASAPLLISEVIRGGLNVVVPAQTFFGPAALFAYLWLRKRGPERTMAQFLAINDAPRTPPNAAIPVPSQSLMHPGTHHDDDPDLIGNRANLPHHQETQPRELEPIAIRDR